MYYKRSSLSLLFTAFALISHPQLSAVSTEETWLEGFSTFAETELKNLSLSNDGILEAAPTLDQFTELDEPVVWAAIQDADGNLILGTGNEGKVIRVNVDGTLTTLFESGDLLVRALAMDADGNIYAGTSPTGRIYKITKEGKAEFFCAPKSSYLWALSIGTDGFLYAATGHPGNIYKIPLDQPPTSTPEPWYVADQDHITTIAWAHDGTLLAGTSPGGVLYRIDAEAVAFALHDTGTEEIKNIIPQNDGSVLFSTFSEQVSRNRRNTRSGQNQSVTVNASASATYYNDEEDTPPPASPQSRASNQNESASTAQSEILKLNPEGFVETVVTSRTGGIHGLEVLPGGEWLAGTDNKGKLYQGRNIHHFRLLQQTPKGGQISLILPDKAHPGAHYVITSNPAVIYRLTASPSESGTLVTNVIDALQSAQWGTTELTGQSLPFSPTLRFRFGNTSTPDVTWSEWAPATAEASSGNPSLQFDLRHPVARYLQLEATVPAGTQLSQIRTSHLLANEPPLVSEIKILPVGFDAAFQEPPMQQNIDFERAMRTTDKASLISGPGPRTQLRRRTESGLYTILWRAMDPNDDQLRYKLSLKSVTDGSWTLLGADLETPIYLLNSKGLADGFYQIKVQASDHLSNRPGKALESDTLSSLFLVDNTPPVLTETARTLDNGILQLTLSALDAHSNLSSGTVTLNGALPTPLLPDDSLWDSRSKSFTYRSPKLSSGAHTLLAEIEDASGNKSVIVVNFTIE